MTAIQLRVPVVVNRGRRIGYASHAMTPTARLTPLLPRLADRLARVSARWVPDSFSIACLLTLVTFALGLTIGRAGPVQCLTAWGSGFWELLSFAMQIAVVIFAGYIVAVSPPVTRALESVAALPRSPRQAVAWTAFLSLVLCWLNWGLGLIASAVLVRFMARRNPGADYRLLVAVAYFGMGATWHAGPSGSVPLLMATPETFMIRDGLIAAPIPLSETVFTATNLVLTAIVTAGLTLFAALLHPPAGQAVRADPRALEALAAFEPPACPARPQPADRLMHSAVPHRLVGLLGLAYMATQIAAAGVNLTLDGVNLLFLSLGLVLHPTTASVVKAAEEAVRPLHGVILQFPLYAGIYGIMKGTALAAALASAFLSVATARTFPLIVFWYSAVLDYFVPSGGGKWAIEALYVLRAGDALGVPVREVAMAYAYGDMATNIIQPFWAIPLLGVARLEFRDILGYEILVFALYTATLSAFLLMS
jgi:short-chain fatty acids transporter